MPEERVGAPTIADERAALAGCLDFLRATAIMKVAGLDKVLASSRPARSAVSPLGVVKHLTQVEHAWFAQRLDDTGEPLLFSTTDDPDADFRIEPAETVETVTARYREVCERSRQILARHDLDDRFDDGRGEVMDARWVVIHMIQETARHVGHLDILREELDGSTGE
ncbi:DinB family protein [Tessaracoccus caeni]|uniref:DinB family protein n=1 Tax=Tessaracoccus caeni TaxID=3031239 RepID=UPI0023D983D8|nr:DinB family protein [Tessaracoccus caeni]MDF1488415.1 DinB family protein [Tessaracoccus caeni]